MQEQWNINQQTSPNFPMKNLQSLKGWLSRPQLAREDIQDEKCRRDPLYWAQTHTKTENPKFAQQGLQFRSPFPQKSYFRPLFDYFDIADRLFIPKTREMQTSWSVMVYATNKAQWHNWEVVVQTDAEDKAKQLVKYATILYENQPAWLRARHPLRQDPSQLAIEWESGGRLFGIPKGENKIRMYHPTLYVMDEAAFLPEAQQCYDAAHPVCQKIIAISSAGPGWFGLQCSR